MPNTREKLIELLDEVQKEGFRFTYVEWVHGDMREEVTNEQIADHLIANGVTVQQWIPVTERLPEPETEVLILAESKRYSFKGTVTTHPIVTTGMHEDGSKNTEDSDWCWYDHDFKYDEELDAYIIPEGWWEYKHYNGDDEHNHPIDDTVTHWMPLPQPPKEPTP